MTQKPEQAAPDPRPDEMNALIAVLNAGRFAELEAKAREVLARYPTSGVVWKILGAALWQQRKDPLPALTSAAEFSPGDAEAHSNLGNALRARGRLEEAVASHRRAVAIAPDYAEAHNNLGSALQDLGRLDEARSSYQTAIEISPRFALAHANLGNASLQLRDPAAAIASYQRALEIQPDLIAALVNMGSALRDLGQANAAETAYRRALALRPDSAELHHNLAVVQRMQSRLAGAETSCRRALELNGNLTSAIAFLARLQVDKGNFPEAEEHYRRAAKIDPNSTEAWSGIPSLRKMTASDAGWLSEAQRIANLRLPPRKEVHLRYALGKYFDDTEDFEQAFVNYRRANELTRLYKAAHHREQLTEFVTLIVQFFDAKWLERPRQDMPVSRRPIFVVGMPRSGTTLAEQILAAHPAVTGAGELPFWGVALARSQAAFDDLNGDRVVRALGTDYVRLLDGISVDAERVVDKMPSNFLSLGLIHAACPNARIIHMQRNPMDTCLSIYFQDFETAYSYANDLDDLAHFYGEYVRIMDHWQSVFREGTILHVPYEALVGDQEKWSRTMLEFVGLPWDPKCLDFHKSTRTVTSLSSWQVRQKINNSSVGRWRRYERFLGPLLELSRFEHRP
jgi:tetratricopeptide (TPR) repeat protein